MGKQQYVGIDVSNQSNGSNKGGYQGIDVSKYESTSNEYQGVDVSKYESTSNEYKGVDTQPDAKVEESLYGFKNTLGENMNYIESAYDAGHFSAEAFGKTDAASINALKPVEAALQKEHAILKRFNMLQEQAKKGFKTTNEFNKYKNSIENIIGKEQIELDAKGKQVIDEETGEPKVIRTGGILQKSRQDVLEKWSEIKNDFSHDPSSLVKDKYGFGWDSFNKEGKIQTGAEYERDFQGVIIQEGKDQQSNDAFQKIFTDAKFLAYDDLMSTDAQMLKAKETYNNNSSEISDSFTKTALTMLKSEDADERHAAHEWINDVVNELGKTDQNLKVMFVDQLKGLGFKAQTQMWSGNSKMIETAFNKLDASAKNTLLENAFENKYKVTTNNEYFPATADKSVSDYQNEMKVGKEMDKWSKELIDNEKDLYTKAFLRAKDTDNISKVFDNLLANTTHFFDASGERGTLSSVEEYVYGAAFTNRGKVVPFEDWFNKIANKEYVTTREVTGTWGGLGFSDTKSTKKETALEQMQLSNGAREYNEFSRTNAKLLKAAKGTGVTYNKEEELKKLYNKIVSSQKAQYDELKFNQEYSKSLVFGGLGNQSAMSMTTIGLDGAIDQTTKSLVNKSVQPKDETLLSKQNNFSKVMGLFQENQGWAKSSQNNLSSVAITNDINYAMNMSEFRDASENNPAKLENFFGQKQDETNKDYKDRMANMQMTYMKYTSLPGYSMYKIYNPNTKKHIYATINNKKLSEIKEDNYTYSRQNWIQETFNLDGEFDLTNRKLPNGKNAFVDTPKLIHQNRQYNLKYSYYDSRGVKQTSIIPFAPIGSMTVEEAQKRANVHLDKLRNDKVNQ
jgi:hypothetical protein